MDEKHLLALYDRRYAQSYDGKFLTSELTRPDAEHEVSLLGQWLAPAARWLDVACGTGYFLSRFPHVSREGIDLSPAMLEIARKANPGVAFHEGSYLLPHAEWRNRWDLVSCMWYAYGLVDTLRDIETLVANLARWTSPTGRCFLPLADPQLITGIELPYRLESPWPGEVRITGILWSYVEDGGAKVHAHQLAPQIEYMRDLFERYYDVVEILTYPPAQPDWQGRRAILASGKRADATDHGAGHS